VLGYKGTIAGGRTQLGVNIFKYEYEDLQAIFGEGPRTIVDNVGEVDGRGFEVDANTAVSENLNLRIGLSYFTSEARNVQAFCENGAILTRADIFDGDDPGDPNVCEGNSIPWAPEWTAFAVVNSTFPVGNGEVFGNLAWSWEEDYRGDWPDEDLAFQKVPALNQTDLVVGYRTDNWNLSAYVENVFNEVWFDGNYADAADPVSIYAQHLFGPSRPRTAGIRFGYEF